MISALLGRGKREQESKERNFIRIGKALSLTKKEVGWLYWERPQRQLIVFGASGSGKSEFLTRLMYEDIVNGFQSFNIDPKGSKSWLEAFFKACDKIGKLYDREEGPIVLALNYPEVSFRFNPLYGLEPHQLAYVVASGLPDSKEPFWWNISYEITLAIALALRAKGLDQICFGDIYEFLNVEKIQELQRKVALVYARNQSEEVSQALTILDKIASYDPQYFPRVNSTLRTYLTRLITGKTGYLLNVKTDRDLLRERIKAGELRFFAFLNAEKEGQTAYDVARLLFAWLLAVVGEYSKEFSTIEPQLRVNVDEATEVGFWEINKAIRLVRERNVAIKLFTQSPSGFKSAFKQNGDVIVQDIINNCDCRVVFSINEPTDQEYFANMSGKILKPKAIVHKSSIALTYMDGTVLEPQDLSQLPAGWGYCFMDGDVYMFYSPLVEDRRKAKIIWKKEEEDRIKADMEVDLTKIYDLVVSMLKIQEHYTQYVQKELKDPLLREFYQKYVGWFEYYADDFNVIVRWMDGLKSIPSVVKGKNPLKHISLVDHSVRVAENIKALIDQTGKPEDKKEQELLFLAGLVHDLGKAIASKEGYKMEDHVRELEELLKVLGVSPEIGEVALKHHDKEGDILVEFLKRADSTARQEETELVSDQIAKQLKEGFDQRQLWELFRSMANVDDQYRVFTYKGRLYVKEDFLNNWIGKQKGTRATSDAVCQAFGFEVRSLKLYKGKQELLTGQYYEVDLPQEDLSLENKKLERPELFRGFKVEFNEG
ncbi:MAG: HD domain-containing protein [Aquificaceae bacterium]